MYCTVGEKSHLTQVSSFQLCNSEHTRNVHSNVNWYIPKNHIVQQKLTEAADPRGEWVHWKGFTRSLLFPRSQRGADMWITLAFTQMLTFRRGHEKKGEDSDRVADSESFCSYGLCLCKSVLMRANVTLWWRRYTSCAYLPSGFVLVGVTVGFSPTPGCLSANRLAGNRVWILVN